MKNDVFGPIISTPDAVLGERRKRVKLFDLQSVNPKLVDQLEEEGWTIDRVLKTKTRLKRPKKHDEVLENRVWCLFQRMGFPVLNEGRGFKIGFRRQDGGEDTKQIDVFAKDEETVVVIECKSKIRMDKKNMRNDIEAFCNLRKPIADAVRKKFGADFNPKIVWSIATKNIIWSEPDLERARQEKLFLLRDEREINYFSQLADHLGFAAKYQMLAEVFSNQKIPELDGKKYLPFVAN